MPIQVRPSGRLEIATPEHKAGIHPGAAGGVAVAADEKSSTNIATDTVASFVNISSTRQLENENENENNDENSVVQGLPPLPNDIDDSRRTGDSTNATVISSQQEQEQPKEDQNNNNTTNEEEHQQEESASVDSFSTVSTCSGASSAQSIQENEFVMIQHHSMNTNSQQSSQGNNNNITAESEQQQQQAATPLPPMIGGAQNMFTPPAPTTPAPSVVSSQPKQPIEEEEKKQPVNQNNNNIAPYRGDIANESPSSTGAVLSRVVESRAEQSLLASQIEERIRTQKEEQDAEDAHRQELESNDIPRKKAILAISTEFEKRWSLSYNVLVREEEQARDLIKMNAKEEKKLAKRKLSPSSSFSKTSSPNLVTDRMIQEQKDLLAFVERTPSSASSSPAYATTGTMSTRSSTAVPSQQQQQTEKSPEIPATPPPTPAAAASASTSNVAKNNNNNTSSSLPQKIFENVANFVTAPFQQQQQQQPARSCECLGASSGYHRKDCPLKK